MLIHDCYATFLGLISDAMTELGGLCCFSHSSLPSCWHFILLCFEDTFYLLPSLFFPLHRPSCSHTYVVYHLFYFVSSPTVIYSVISFALTLYGSYLQNIIFLRHDRKGGLWAHEEMCCGGEAEVYCEPPQVPGASHQQGWPEGPACYCCWRRGSIKNHWHATVLFSSFANHQKYSSDIISLECLGIPIVWHYIINILSNELVFV